jgi:hypothetical protein
LCCPGVGSPGAASVSVEAPVETLGQPSVSVEAPVETGETAPFEGQKTAGGRVSFISENPNIGTDVTEVDQSGVAEPERPGFEKSQASTMPAHIAKMVFDVFAQMDADGGGTIEVEEAQKFFSRSAFSKVSAKAMMDAMDKDLNQSLSREEWNDYFEKVWASGLYDQDELEEEIESMLQGLPFTLAARLQSAGGGIRSTSSVPKGQKIT